MQEKFLAYALSRYLRLGGHFIGWGVKRLRYFSKTLFRSLSSFARIYLDGTSRPIDPPVSDARKKDRIVDMAQGGNEMLMAALARV
jgi:hypothetical protein